MCGGLVCVSHPVLQAGPRPQPPTELCARCRLLLLPSQQGLLCGRPGSQSCCTSPNVCVGGSQCVNLGSAANMFAPQQLQTQQQLQAATPECVGDTILVNNICCAPGSVCNGEKALALAAAAHCSALGSERPSLVSHAAQARVARQRKHATAASAAARQYSSAARSAAPQAKCAWAAAAAAPQTRRAARSAGEHAPAAAAEPATCPAFRSSVMLAHRACLSAAALPLAPQPGRHGVCERRMLPDRAAVWLVERAGLLRQRATVRPHLGAVLRCGRRAARWRLLHAVKRVRAQLLPDGAALPQRRNVLQPPERVWRQQLLHGGRDLRRQRAVLVSADAAPLTGMSQLALHALALHAFLGVAAR